MDQRQGNWWLWTKSNVREMIKADFMYVEKEKEEDCPALCRYIYSKIREIDKKRKEISVAINYNSNI